MRLRLETYSLLQLIAKSDDSVSALEVAQAANMAKDTVRKRMLLLSDAGYLVKQLLVAPDNPNRKTNTWLFSISEQGQQALNSRGHVPSVLERKRQQQARPTYNSVWSYAQSFCGVQHAAH